MQFLWPQYTDADRARRPNGKLVLEDYMSHAKQQYYHKITRHLETLALNALDGVRSWTTTQTPRCVVDAVELRYNELVAQELTEVDPLCSAENQYQCNEAIGGLLGSTEGGEAELDHRYSAGCTVTVPKQDLSDNTVYQPTMQGDVAYLWPECTDAHRAANPKGKRELEMLLGTTNDDKRLNKCLSTYPGHGIRAVRAWVTSQTPKHVVKAIKKRYQEVKFITAAVPKGTAPTTSEEAGTSVKFLWPKYTDADRAASAKGKRGLQSLVYGTEDVELRLSNYSVSALDGVCAWVTTKTPKKVVEALNKRYNEVQSAAAVPKGTAPTTSEEAGTSVKFLWPKYTDADRAANTKGKRGLEILLQTTDDVKLSNCLSNYSVSALDGVCAWVTTKTPKNVVEALNKRHKEVKPAAVPKGTAPTTSEEAGTSVKFLWPKYTDADRAANSKGKRGLEILLQTTDDVKLSNCLSNYSVSALDGVRAWVTTKTPKNVVEALNKRYKVVKSAAAVPKGTTAATKEDAGNNGQSVKFLWPKYTDADRAASAKGKRGLQSLVYGTEDVELRLSNYSVSALDGVCAWVTTKTPKKVVEALNKRYNEVQSAAAVPKGTAPTTSEEAGTSVKFLWPKYTDADRAANTKGRRGLKILLQTTDDVKLSNCLSNYSVSALDGVCAWVTTKTPKNVVEALNKRHKEVKPAAVPKGTTATPKEDAGNNGQSVQFLWSTYTDADRENNPSGKRTLEDHLLKMTEQQIDKHLSNFSLDALVKVCAWVTTKTPKNVVEALNKRYKVVKSAAAVPKGTTAATKKDAANSGQSVNFLWSTYTDADRENNPYQKRYNELMPAMPTNNGGADATTKQVSESGTYLLWPKYTDGDRGSNGEKKLGKLLNLNQEAATTHIEVIKGVRIANPKGNLTVEQLPKMTERTLMEQVQSFSANVWKGVCAWVQGAGNRECHAKQDERRGGVGSNADTSSSCGIY